MSLTSRTQLISYRRGFCAGAAALVVLLCCTVWSASARAADSCGSGYHKQEDGQISASKTGKQDTQKLFVQVGGWVRWCTRDRTASRDQFFQRVKVGVPTAITWRSLFSGANRRKVCLTSSFTAAIRNGVSADISIATDAVGATIKDNGQGARTVTMPQLCRSGAAAQSTSAFQQVANNFSVTVPNCGLLGVSAPSVKSITFSTLAYVQYQAGAEVRDFSLRISNTDVPNDPARLSC